MIFDEMFNHWNSIDPFQILLNCWCIKFNLVEISSKDSKPLNLQQCHFNKLLLLRRNGL